MATTECPDAHKCKNGSLCVEDQINEGSFYCDCDVEPLFAFAGLSCEHEGTVFCNLEGLVSKSSFCTNGGTCRQFVEVDGLHLGCVCDSGYNGEFCQFTENQNVPTNWPTLTAAERAEILKGDEDGDAAAGGGSSGPNSIGIVAGVVGAVVVLLGALYITMKRRRYAEPHAIEKTRSDGSALHLDADGDVLSQAMTPNSIAESPRSFGEDGDVSDDIEVTDVI